MQYLLDGIVHYNDESRILTDNKREVELSLATSRLLNALIDANNSQVSRTELLEKVWEEHGLVASDNNLNRNISLLRKAFLEFSLEDKIETIPKQGFVLHCQCTRVREGANKQVISSQADSLIKISRIWADFFPANTSNQPI
ncbi:winged helix-turn-helix domain-containing protein [Enterobacter cloacae]|nr:winged helix-turn-helix domain-containing protein [Enterobacter cloacae]UOY99390.1 winged helix-turn-helix domain-containing protein [Enterobacter cloacae subsp. cloacae]